MQMPICSPNRCRDSRNSCTPQPRGRTRSGPISRCVRAQGLVGETVSFVFNKLKGIALSEQPTTPALSKKCLPAEFVSDYMTSHINWVIQSFRVVRAWTTFTCSPSPWIIFYAYDMDARYLISIHDGLRHLVAERDLHRAALALQIANLWT